MKLFLFAIVMSLVATRLSAQVQGPGSTELASEVVDIPMDLSTRHVSVEVDVGGEGPLPFNLDTYCIYTAAVDDDFAGRMGFEKVGIANNGDGSGKTRQLDIVMIPELRFGGATFREVRAVVDDYSWVDTPEGGSIQGLLGYHLFRDLLLELDYPNHRVRLREGELPAQGDHVVSFPALRTSPDIPIHVGDRRLILGIDSGADAGLLLSSSYLDAFDLVKQPRITGRARMANSAGPVWTAVLGESVLLAGHEITRARVTFSPLFGHPTLGHGQLVEYSVTFDQRNGRVRFLRPARGTATTGGAP